jgi:YfiH family protein
VCDPLEAVAPHVFTGRDLEPAGRPDARRDTFARLAGLLGIDPARLREARQVHGAAAVVAGDGPWSSDTAADILVTDDPGVGVVVRVADCVPVLMADGRTGAVAAVHAGWRGTCAGAVAAAVRTLQAEYASQPADLVAAIGPAIGPCCYQVGEDVHSAFLARRDALDRPDRWFRRDGDRWRLDIGAANRDQLAGSGVPPGAIHVAGVCTACSIARFYSYRAEASRAGRQFAAIRPRGRLNRASGVGR